MAAAWARARDTQSAWSYCPCSDHARTADRAARGGRGAQASRGTRLHAPGRNRTLERSPLVREPAHSPRQSACACCRCEHESVLRGSCAQTRALACSASSRTCEPQSRPSQTRQGGFAHAERALCDKLVREQRSVRRQQLHGRARDVVARLGLDLRRGEHALKQERSPHDLPTRALSDLQRRQFGCNEQQRAFSRCSAGTQLGKAASKPRSPRNTPATMGRWARRSSGWGLRRSPANTARSHLTDFRAHVLQRAAMQKARNQRIGGGGGAHEAVRRRTSSSACISVAAILSTESPTRCGYVAHSAPSVLMTSPRTVARRARQRATPMPLLR
jgi:hypothetical protein